MKEEIKKEGISSSAFIKTSLTIPIFFSFSPLSADKKHKLL